MVVARYSHGQLVILDRCAKWSAWPRAWATAGVSTIRRRSAHCDASRDSASGCEPCAPTALRVVGTNALRRAKRKRWFLERARAALGHPIEIISGLEEARLIYSGVAHTSPMSPDKRLVIDIGGGSTEVVIGEGFEPLLLESLSVGCVG